MRILLVTLMTSLLVSCASQQTPKEIDPAQNIAVTNKDFTRQRPVTYVEGNDHYAQIKGSALSTESANLLPSSQAKLLVEGKDAVDRMIALCYKGDFKTGLSMAEAGYEKFQNIPTFWNQVATCHLLSGNDRKALLFYNKALELSPNYVPSLNNIGVIYSKQKEDQKAFAAFKRAYEQNKFAKTPRFNMAHLLLKYGQAESALKHFQGIGGASDGDSDIQSGMANAYYLLGKYSEAFQLFSRIPADKQRLGEVGINYALTCHFLGKGPEAKKILAAVKSSREFRDYYEKARALVGE